MGNTNICADIEEFVCSRREMTFEQEYDYEDERKNQKSESAKFQNTIKEDSFSQKIVQANLLRSSSDNEKVKKLKELGEIITEEEFYKFLREKINKFKNESPFSKDSQLIKEKSNSLCLKFKNGDVYSGQFNQNFEFDGRGILVKSGSSNIMEGVWNRGVLTRGSIYNPTGTFYEGEIEKELPNGNGVYSYPDRVCSGQWIGGQLHGLADIKYSDGVVLKAQFENGVALKGKFVWCDGSSYEGDIVNNDIGTYGTFTTSKGDVYNGQWKDGLPDGEGIHSWVEGEKYVGQYKKGKRDGKGIYYFNPQSNYYDGSWAVGKPHGHGKYHTPESIKIGIWRFGRILKIFSEAKLNANTSQELNSEIDYAGCNFDLKFENIVTKTLPHLERKEVSDKSTFSSISLKPKNYDKVLFAKLVNMENSESTKMKENVFSQNIQFQEQSNLNQNLKQKTSNKSSNFYMKSKNNIGEDKENFEINIRKKTVEKAY